MGEVIWGHDFTARNPQKGAQDTQIRTREDAVDYLAAELERMLELDPCHSIQATLIDHAKAGSPVEPPADCPA